MTPRKKLRAIMAGKKLVLMPGAYDALSARVIEMEGFEAIVAGGYAAVGSMLAQADMGQSNMRDYAGHYGRICDAVEIPVYVDADTGFGGVNNVRQMIRAFEAAGVAGLFISDQVFPNRCGYLPGKQIVPIEQMLANNIRVIVAKSFADIYRENCLQNGLLPVVLEPDQADAFIARVVAVNGAAQFTVDLKTQTITGPGGPDIRFDIPEADRMRLLEGLDDIGLTLKQTDDIIAFEKQMAASQPWLQQAKDSRQ